MSYTRISRDNIVRLATEGKLEYVIDAGIASAHAIPLRPEQIAAPDATWDLVDMPGYDGPGAYIDRQTGDMWRVTVHMGDYPRRIMEAGVVRASVFGEALLPYLPHHMMHPVS